MNIDTQKYFPSVFEIKNNDCNFIQLNQIVLDFLTEMQYFDYFKLNIKLKQESL